MITFAPGNLRVPKWTRPVYMVAAGTTDFRKRYPEKKLEELCMMAFRMLLEENDLKMDPLEVKGLINFASLRRVRRPLPGPAPLRGEGPRLPRPRPAAQRRRQDRRRHRRLHDARRRHDDRERLLRLHARPRLGADGRGQDLDRQLLHRHRRPARTSRRAWPATTRATTRRWPAASRRCTTSTSGCAPRSR